MSSTKDKVIRGVILDQAQILFQQFGLKKTTMDEIAAACGKAKSTLYHYYKSKEEVFEAVIEIELISLRQITKEKVDKETTTKDKVGRYLISFHEEILSKLNLYRIVKHELVNEALGKQYFNKMMKFEQAYITRLLEDGYDSGEWTEIPKEELSLLSEILLAAFFGIVRYSVESESGFDQKKLVQTAKILIPKIFG